MTAPPRDLIGWLDHYLVEKAPFQLPAQLREFLARAAPWIALVRLVLSLGPALFFLGVRSGWHWWDGERHFAAGLWLVGIAYLAHAALLFLALPGLFNRRESGWSLAFYATLLGVLMSVVLLRNFVGGILSGIVVLYLLFQIRAYFQARRSPA